MKRNFIILILIGVLVSNSVIGQNSNTNKKWGISSAIQTNQLSLLFPVNLSETLSLVPALGFTFSEEIGNDITLGLIPKVYLQKSDLSPYVTFKMGTIIFVPSSKNVFVEDNTYDVIFGPSFGGEYFFNESFSVGVEAQGNFTLSDENSNRFGNPDKITFNTATMIYGTIYF